MEQGVTPKPLPREPVERCRPRRDREGAFFFPIGFLHRPRHRLDAKACALVILCVVTAAVAHAAPPACAEAARQWAPCELTFDWKDGEIPPDSAALRADLMSIEFRSPAAR